MTLPSATNPLAATRDSWHRVAEHVIAAAQFADTGKIALRSVAGGFQTTRPLRGGRQLSVVNTQLVITDETGTRTTPLTTIAAAADFAGITPGMPATVYPPATPLQPHEPLYLDTDSTQQLAALYELADAALRRFASDLGAGSQQPVLWPEHFDIGITFDEVNYGASPGDAHLAQPYLYIGPHAGPPIRDAFWNASFGAVRAMHETRSVEEAVAFYHAGHARLST
jgi:hypothetical protein